MSDPTLFNKFGRVVENGQLIFREGEDGDQMYIIQDGAVKISKNIGGREHTLAVLNKGDFFGEMAIVSMMKRSANASAVGEVHLLAFNREGFIQMIEKNAKIALNIIDKLCKRIDQANQQIKILVKKDIKSLIALNLYYSLQGAGVDAENLYYDQITGNIAKNMELPLKLIQDKFQDFENEKIISITGNKITINNIDKLKE
jgi:CRP-like cAMP-binding protein